VPGHREVEVGSSLVLGVALLSTPTGTGPASQFANCSALPVNWALTAGDSVTDPEIVPCEEYTPISTDLLTPCVCAKVTSQRDGQCSSQIQKKKTTQPEIQNLIILLAARIVTGYETISDETYQDKSRNLALTNTATLAGFRPLTAVPSRILVTLGSSYKVAISGGPQPWQFQQLIAPTIELEQQKVTIVHTPQVLSTSSGTAGASLHSTSSTTVYMEVICNELHAQNMSVLVTNPASATNPHPVVSRRTVLFECKPPHQVFVFPHQPTLVEGGSGNCVEMEMPKINTWTNDDENTEQRFETLPSKFTLRNDRTVPFNVTIFDEKGHIFDNFTSLSINVASTNEVSPFLFLFCRWSVLELTPFAWV